MVVSTILILTRTLNVRYASNGVIQHENVIIGLMWNILVLLIVLMLMESHHNNTMHCWLSLLLLLLQALDSGVTTHVTSYINNLSSSQIYTGTDEVYKFVYISHWFNSTFNF
jgi:hypothetical protein